MFPFRLRRPRSPGEPIGFPKGNYPIAFSAAEGWGGAVGDLSSSQFLLSGYQTSPGRILYIPVLVAGMQGLSLLS